MSDNQLAFVNKNWKKNWDGHWSLLTCAYLSYQYTKQLSEKLGVSMEEALTVTKQGMTACYFIDDHKKVFAEALKVEAINNPEKLHEWSELFKKTTDKALSVIADLKQKEISKANFELFIEALYEYGIYHRIIKVIVDYLPAELLSKYLEEMSEARVYAEPVYEKSEEYMRYLAAQIGEPRGIKAELILAMTEEQLENFLDKGELPDQAILEKQYQGAVMYVTQGEKHYYFNEREIEEIEKSLLSKKASDSIKGQIAYKGKVQGRVRVILDARNASEFNEGEILVTGMTRPEYLSLVEKSAGFITDAGGVLSHAAITARELKKPCLIGTEIATKVLHDGDLIELDADRGIITKL